MALKEGPITDYKHIRTVREKIYGLPIGDKIGEQYVRSRVIPDLKDTPTAVGIMSHPSPSREEQITIEIPVYKPELSTAVEGQVADNLRTIIKDYEKGYENFKKTDPKPLKNVPWVGSTIGHLKTMSGLEQRIDNKTGKEQWVGFRQIMVVDPTVQNVVLVGEKVITHINGEQNPLFAKELKRSKKAVIAEARRQEKMQPKEHAITKKELYIGDRIYYLQVVDKVWEDEKGRKNLEKYPRVIQFTTPPENTDELSWIEVDREPEVVFKRDGKRIKRASKTLHKTITDLTKKVQNSITANYSHLMNA